MTLATELVVVEVITLQVTQVNYILRILTTNSFFENNLATVGGAGHLALFSGVKNTQIEFINCTFNFNGQFITNLSNRQVAGAGLYVTADNQRPDNELTTPPPVSHNLSTTLRIIGSNFTENFASFGAGLYFYSSYQSAVSDLTDVLHMYIEGCWFERNRAFVGPGMQLIENKYGAGNVGAQIEIKDSNFANNTVISVDPEGIQSTLQSAGVIDIR